MNIRKLLSIVLVIAWMMIVFYFSHQQGEGSGSMSKTIVIKAIEIVDIKNNISYEQKEEIVKIVEPIIRKLAHLCIYILGGMLILNCIYQFIKINKISIICSALIGVSYAISDEIHQLFIIGRSGNAKDVIIDSLGIFIGISIYLLVVKTINKFRTNSID